jgi:hypothetical protein
MADFTGGIRNANVFSAMGKDLAITKLAKTNITQDELDAAISFIGLTTTVVGIADDTTGGFNAGVSDAVHVLTEGGIAPVAASNFGEGATGVTATVVAYFAV